MSVVDLKYAKDGKQPEQPQEILLSVAVRGWGWGWAYYVDGQPSTAGHFRVPDHDQGHALAHPRKVVMAFQALFQLAEQQRFNILVTEQREKTAPAATMLPILCALVGSRYLEASKTWMDDLGLKRKELDSWATVVLGKPAQDETVVQALGLGNWYARMSKRSRGEL